MVVIMAQTETGLTRAILRYLNQTKNCHAIKLHADATQGKGHPDIFACVDGRAVLIEVKRPGEQPTLIQRYALGKWQHAGATVVVATSLKDVVNLVLTTTRGEN